jgi:serine protease
MTEHADIPIRRRARLAALATAAAVGLVWPAAAHAATPVQPGELASHPYRHGLVPTLDAASLPIGLNNLSYGGGVSGVGVTTGAAKVYLVFWGSQWGTSGTDANGYTTLTGDPQHTAPILQGFFKGLGTGSETWSGVMTQYCQGVATGSQTCPAGSAHVGYPTGGALAGVWVDTSAAAPAQATGKQLGTEAVAAAGHFGNTTSTANRNAQYVILSPTGTHPDGFNTVSSNWCAWHDYTGDTSLSGGAPSSPYGPLAFTNMPYVTDMGSSCGSNFVNSGAAGVDDGVTIVEGHEYAETITDQFPAGGWTDLTGEENADKCAWISSGQGAAQNIALTTGSYPVQSTWANDYNSGSGGCEVSHAVVS